MLKCLACHVCAHVAPEEVPEAFLSSRPATIRLNPTWSRPISEGSYTSTSAPPWPCSTSVMAMTTSRTGSEIDRATKIIARNPKARDATASTRTGVSIGADFGTSHPLERDKTINAIPAMGNALKRTHVIITRASTPGISLEGSAVFIDAARMGRRMR